MREWNHSDIVEVLDEWKASTELADIDQIAEATDCRCQLILLNFAFKKTLQIVDIEATRTEALLIYSFEFIFTTVISLFNLPLLRNIVTYAVEVALMDIYAVPNV